MDLLAPEDLTVADTGLLAGAGPSASHAVRMPSGSLACIIRLLFTHAIISELHDFGHEDRWCYKTQGEAVTALLAWSGEEGTEPDGWIRHPNTDRRRPHAANHATPAA